MRETFTRAEVAELMWRWSMPWLEVDRWSARFRAEREPLFREDIEAKIDRFLGERDAHKSLPHTYIDCAPKPTATQSP